MQALYRMPEFDRCPVLLLTPSGRDFSVAQALLQAAGIGSLACKDVRQLGAICERSPACVLELANEPDHSTQDRALADPALLFALRQTVPRRVMVAFGAANGPNDDRPDWSGGDFVTMRNGAAIRLEIRQ